ncbi:MAG: type II toxin-antitoxin system VapC family toxin [Candidatus Nitrosocaldus sp.]|nr:type II toxin-antitoxin system VapC family toxin [Candidatus Nitrosocaldus sp.]
MIVIDASVLTKYILREEGNGEVREYLLDQPYSVTLVFVETSNAIWKHHALHKTISREEAYLMLSTK